MAFGQHAEGRGDHRAHKAAGGIVRADCAEMSGDYHLRTRYRILQRIAIAAGAVDQRNSGVTFKDASQNALDRRER